MEGKCRDLQRIERSGAIAPDDLSPRGKILYITAKGGKLHRTVIVKSKLANRYKILITARRDENIIKMKLMWDGNVAYRSDSNRMSVSNNHG